EIIEAARDAARQKPLAVVAGGGDGTINAVASMLIGSEIALGVLPMGTLNHFAKDLNIPLELEAATHNIIAGHAIQIDVGEVNGRIFLNNSSLGLYPTMVIHREKQQQRLGRRKWHAFAWAVLTMLRRYPFMSVRLSTNDQELIRSTPFVFVGNNEYQMDGFNIGVRGCLDAGQLSVYVPHRTGRLALLRLALRALFGRLHEARNLDTLCTKAIWIDTHRKRLHVAIDGQVALIDTPLHYSVRPGALRVIVPENRESNGAEEVEHAHARPPL
ncbi:MAG: diacylglycerol/lipid kinase family protein, partial [Candidatus Binatia bacterium]